MGYLTYIGTASPYYTSVTVGNVVESVVAVPGQTQHFDDGISAALIAAQPSLWQPKSGFPSPALVATSVPLTVAGMPMGLGWPGLIGGSNTGATSANFAHGFRIVIPPVPGLSDSLVLHDLGVFFGTSSGNIEVGILDTSATTRNRLWTTGAIPCPTSSAWHTYDPALSVKVGDHYDLYLGVDNATVAFVRPGVNTQTNTMTLPPNFLVSPLGGAPIVQWAAATSFPMPATIAEASLAQTVAPATIIYRLAAT